MLLYHYTKLQYGLAAIRDKQLKIARYDALNDPFDIMGLAFSQQEERDRLDELKEKLGKTNGIICLSETWKEPLMWGHYADSHKGVCLGFEVRAGHYEKIHYREDRPTLGTYGRKSIEELSTDDLKKIAHNKFERWHYEREWRRIVTLNNEDFVDGNYYLPFGTEEGMKLKYVFFGMNCKIDKAKIARIAAVNPTVKFAITEPASKDFDIIISPNKTKENVASQNWVLQVAVPKSLEVQHSFELMLEMNQKLLDGDPIKERDKRLRQIEEEIRLRPVNERDKRLRDMSAKILKQVALKSAEEHARYQALIEKTRADFLKSKS